MSSRLSAGASCQLCREPFGRLEDLRAPFPIACGHVFCIGCLNSDESCCHICGATYDRHVYGRLLSLVGNISQHQSLPLDPEEVGSRLRDDIAGVNDITPLTRVRQIYDTCHFFLDSQPRSCFRDLETNVSLLGYLIKAKEIGQAQVAVSNTLVDSVHRLSSENLQLEEKLKEMNEKFSFEKAYVRDHVDELLRRNPDYNLLSDEVLRLQSEMNDLQQAMHVLRVRRGSEPIIPVPPTIEFAPRIRVYPASRSPSPVTSAVDGSEAHYSLSPLAMSSIRDDFSTHLQSPPFTGNLDIPSLRINRSPPTVSADVSPTLTTHQSELSLENFTPLSHDADQYASSEHDSSSESVDTFLSMEDDGIRSQPTSPGRHRDMWDVGSPPDEEEGDPSLLALEHDTRHESSGYADSEADAFSVLSTSTLSLPLLRTPDRWRAGAVPNSSGAHLLGGEAAPNFIAPAPSIRLTPEHFFASIANLTGLGDDVRRDTVSRTPNTPAHLLARAADVVRSNTFRRHLSPAGGLSSNQTLLADMRACFVEMIARVFVHIASDSNIQIAPSSVLSQTHAAAMYTSHQLGAQSSSFLDALDDASSVFFTPLNPNPSSLVTTPPPETLPDLISLD